MRYQAIPPIKLPAPTDSMFLMISGNINWNLSDKESADVRIEKSDGNKHSKNKMASPELLQVFC